MSEPACATAKRWAHRVALGLAGFNVAVAVAFAVANGTPIGLGLIPWVCLVVFLARRDVRHWFRGTTETDELERIDEREARRARRRLAPDEPSLTDISERMRSWRERRG